MHEEINNFLTYLKTQKGLKDNSIIAYKKDLHKFEEYLTDERISLDNLKRYQFRAFLAELNNRKLSNKSINRILAAIKGFIKYKIRFGYKDTATILEIESLKTSTYLPKFLFDDEINELLNFTCIKKEDFRDKALFELIFATGLRVSEVVNIILPDINQSKKQIKVMGKGSKERIVIYGDHCKTLLENYLSIRDNFIKDANTPPHQSKSLFLNKYGKTLTTRGVRYILDKRIKQTALLKKISPHALRHSFATCMIRNGADIRTVQILLGHESLATTQIYTHLNLDELKDIHYKFHPHGKD